MSEVHRNPSWLALPNPFLRRAKPLPSATERDAYTSDSIEGYVSGRRTAITEILMGAQSAIILAGSPNIGKSALISYLEDAPGSWSWRKELPLLQLQMDLEAIHFICVDLTPLETEPSLENLVIAFQRQCALAVQAAYPESTEPYSTDLSGLRQLLRHIARENPDARYFVMLDNIERLGRLAVAKLKESNAETEEDRDMARGMTLLDHSGALRTLVDLMDEFSTFGVILSIEALPHSSINEQLRHCSADLARFTTRILKTFSWEDTLLFLQQPPASFGASWAHHFCSLSHASTLFSEAEQSWLLEQAGTHPYFLHQFCFYSFQVKMRSAQLSGLWMPLELTQQRQIDDTVKERLSIFLLNIWNRLERALQFCSQETRSQFSQWALSSTASPNHVIEGWNQYSPELRYILACEGVICFDEAHSARYPGTVLLNYLIQAAQKSSLRPVQIPATSSIVPGKSSRSFWLTTTLPGNKPEPLALSEKEYRLLSTLLQHPEACTATMLKEGAWGSQPISNTAFTQRMHQLHKKLKKQYGEDDVIEKRYRGQYILKHPERFQLQ